jgi:uncharacterized Tic20 family protein
MAIGEPLHADPLTGESSTQQQRSQASLAHALALLGFFVPFANIVAPLLIMVNDKSQGNFVKDHARESLNFQITMMIASFLLVPLCFVLIGIPLLCALVIFEVVVIIRATLAANEGRSYQYPLTIRLLK